jgi:Tfp pilus assembly protein PilZ
MKKRPLILRVIVALAVLFPVLMVGQMLLVGGLGAGAALRRLIWTPDPVLVPVEYLLATALAWLLAWSAWQVKPWSFWVMVALGAALVGHNYWVLFFRTRDPSDLYLVAFSVLTIGPAVALVLLLQREVRAPFFNPRVRWWEQDPRHAVDLPEAGGGRVRDLSRTGLFLQTDRPLSPGERVPVAFTLGEQPLTAEAEVVWASPGGATHPAGAGLRFVGLASGARIALERALRGLRDQEAKEWCRQSIRYPTDIRCDEDDVVLDLSRGGMFVQSTAPRPLGHRASWRLRRGDHDLNVTGEVVWTSDGSSGRPAGFGVRFGSLPRPARAALDRLVGALATGG